MSNDQQPVEVYEKLASGWSLPPQIYIVALYDDFEGFRVLLRGEDSAQPILRIRFSNPFAYRSLNESDRLRTWARNPEAMRSILFEVRNSRWLKWLYAESAETMPRDQIRHFAVYSFEDCVDVACASEPTFDWLGGRPSAQQAE